MSWPSFVVAHVVAGLIVLCCWVGGIALVSAVVIGSTSPWLLLLAALFIWIGFEQTAELYQWYSRLPEKRLAVTEQGFLFGQQLLSYSQVFIIFCMPKITNKRLNFIPRGRDFNVLASILMRDGREYKLRAGPGPVTWFGPTYGAAESKRLVLKLRAGHERTTATWAEE